MKPLSATLVSTRFPPSPEMENSGMRPMSNGTHTYSTAGAGPRATAASLSTSVSSPASSVVRPPCWSTTRPPRSPGYTGLSNW